jgi:hypothetical protein
LPAQIVSTILVLPIYTTRKGIPFSIFVYENETSRSYLDISISYKVGRYMPHHVRDETQSAPSTIPRAGFISCTPWLIRA